MLSVQSPLIVGTFSRWPVTPIRSLVPGQSLVKPIRVPIIIYLLSRLWFQLNLLHCHSNSDNGIKQCFSIALNETDDNNGDSDYNELEKYNDSNNSIEVLEESSDNEEESDKKVD